MDLFNLFKMADIRTNSRFYNLVFIYFENRPNPVNHFKMVTT